MDLTYLFQEALVYQGWGWAILPLTADKKPAINYWKWLRRRVPTEKDIYRFIFSADRPTCGIAVVHGNASGQTGCMDFDDVDAYRRWADGHPELAATLPTARTARGFHVYHRSPYEAYKSITGGQYLGNDKRYTVLPPSLHPNGSHYEWVNFPTDKDFRLISPVDAGFLTPAQVHPGRKTDKTGCNTTKSESDTKVRFRGQLTPAVLNYLIEGVDRMVPTGEGQRNACIWRLVVWARNVCPVATAEQMKPVFHAWWAMACSVVKTKEMWKSESDFCRMWNDVAFTASKTGATDETLRDVCERLSKINPAGFHLSSRLAAEWMGGEPTHGQPATATGGQGRVVDRGAEGHRLGDIPHRVGVSSGG